MSEAHPGETAPVAGHYEELNVFGIRTGKLVYVEQGEQLPQAPRGFSWRRVATEGDGEES